MAKNKENIMVRICKEYAKFSEGLSMEENLAILEISMLDYIAFIKWDCESLCLYQPSFLNPPPIVGLKVKLKAKGKLRIFK